MPAEVKSLCSLIWDMDWCSPLRFARFCSCLQSLAAGEVSVLSSTSGSLKFADLNQGQSLAWWTWLAKRHLCPTPQKWSKVKVKVLVNMVVMIRHGICRDQRMKKLLHASLINWHSFQYFCIQVYKHTVYKSNRYDKVSDVVESWVQWRSDFQSGSRV